MYHSGSICVFVRQMMKVLLTYDHTAVDKDTKGCMELDGRDLRAMTRDEILHVRDCVDGIERVLELEVTEH